MNNLEVLFPSQWNKLKVSKHFRKTEVMLNSNVQGRFFFNLGHATNRVFKLMVGDQSRLWNYSLFIKYDSFKISLETSRVLRFWIPE